MDKYMVIKSDIIAKEILNIKSFMAMMALNGIVSDRIAITWEMGEHVRAYVVQTPIQQELQQCIFSYVLPVKHELSETFLFITSAAYQVLKTFNPKLLEGVIALN